MSAEPGFGIGGVEKPVPDGERRTAVRLVAYKPNRIEVEVESNFNGFLVVSDGYHPGWTAEVDGESREVLRANSIMRAVPVASGRHRVTFTFRPLLLRSGVLLSALSWLILAGLIGAGIISKVRRALREGVF